MTAVSGFLACRELAVDEERLLLVGQWPAKCTLGKPLAELAKLRLAVRRVLTHASQFLEMGGNVSRDLDRRIRGRLIPGL